MYITYMRGDGEMGRSEEEARRGEREEEEESIGGDTLIRSRTIYSTVRML